MHIGRVASFVGEFDVATLARGALGGTRGLAVGCGVWAFATEGAALRDVSEERCMCHSVPSPPNWTFGWERKRSVSRHDVSVSWVEQGRGRGSTRRRRRVRV